MLAPSPGLQDDRVPDSGGLTRQHITPCISDHPGTGKVDVQLRCGLQEQPGIGLATGAAVFLPVRTHVNTGELSALATDQPGEPVIDLYSSLQSQQSLSNRGLVGHDYDLVFLQMGSGEGPDGPWNDIHMGPVTHVVRSILNQHPIPVQEDRRKHNAIIPSADAMKITA